MSQSFLVVREDYELSSHLMDYGLWLVESFSCGRYGLWESRRLHWDGEFSPVSSSIAALHALDNRHNKNAYTLCALCFMAYALWLMRYGLCLICFTPCIFSLCLSAVLVIPGHWCSCLSKVERLESPAESQQRYNRWTSRDQRVALVTIGDSATRMRVERVTDDEERSSAPGRTSTIAGYSIEVSPDDRHRSSGQC
jgi:hypothetical protein